MEVGGADGGVEEGEVGLRRGGGRVRRLRGVDVGFEL